MTETNTNELSHIAIIMDGNRRWATERHLPKMIGHTEGGKNLKKILQAAKEKGVNFLTVWALSTENLTERSDDELKHLFSLFEKLLDYLGDFKKNNIKVKIIGDLTKLPLPTQNKLNDIVKLTNDNTGLCFVLAVNYGGRDELIRTIKKLISDNVKPQDVDEKLISNYLDTKDIPEPELIIRTGGASRLSGFLPWQGIYSELYFTKTYWPDFSKNDLDSAIDWYQQQKRNRGK